MSDKSDSLSPPPSTVPSPQAESSGSATFVPDMQSLPPTVPKKKPPRFTKPTELVTIEGGQGSNSEDFVVHKEFACHSSAVCPTSVRQCLGRGLNSDLWLCTKQLDTPQLDETAGTKHAGCEDPSKKELNIASDKSYTPTRLWLLADRLEISRLQNMAMHRLEQLRKSSNMVTTAIFNYVWALTKPGNALRKYFVQAWIYQYIGKAHFPHRFPREMLFEITEFYAQMVKDLKEKTICPSNGMRPFEVSEDYGVAAAMIWACRLSNLNG